MFKCKFVYTQLHIGECLLERKKQDSNSEVLSQILQTLNQINNKLEETLEVNRQLLKTNEILTQRTEKTDLPTLTREPTSMAMLNLPSALRKTIMVLYNLEKATADDLAKETKRLRAMESATANELVRMGYIKKKREGREVYFYIETPEENAYE
jgi:hypothetical protein